MRVLGVVIGLIYVAKAPSIDETTVYEQAFFGLSAFLGAVLAVLGLATLRKVIIAGSFLAWATFMSVTSLQYPLSLGGAYRPPLMDFWIDLVVMLAPLFLAIVIPIFAPARMQLIKWLILIAAIGMLAAIISWWTAPSGMRFRPPPNLTIAAAWALAVVPLPERMAGSGAQMRVRRIAFGCVGALLILSWLSQSRTAVITWVLCGALVLFVPRGASTLKHRGPVIFGLIGVFLLSLASNELATRVAAEFGQSRLALTGLGMQDVSTMARVQEIQDVLRTMGQSSFLEQLLGLGHGAGYVPTSSLMTVNLDAATGRIHNVHNTQALVYLRYGVIGVCLYLVLILAMYRRAFVEVWARSDLLSVMLLLLVVATTFDALVRNSFVDPSFFLTIALLAVVKWLPREEVRARA